MVYFGWDEAKAASNKRKHGVRFEDAMLVFADPYALADQDRIEGGEVRWQTLGLAGGVVLVLVAHTVRNEAQDEIIRIISARKAVREETSDMTKIVRKSFSGSPVTAARKHRLSKFAGRPDSEIDTSDIPELTEKFWRNAVRNPFYRPIKKQLTLRLDADVIAWLRLQGKGYQTRANALLRAAMLQEVDQTRKKKNRLPSLDRQPRRGFSRTRRVG
jgi:uncharacterized DUF497 family protein